MFSDLSWYFGSRRKLRQAIDNLSLLEGLESRMLLSAAPADPSALLHAAPAVATVAHTKHAAPAIDSTQTDGSLVLGTTWQGSAFTNPGGGYEITFDAVPSQQRSYTIIGLSTGTAKHFAQLGLGIEFKLNNTIAARNGSVYTADSKVKYVAGTTYSFEFDVDPSTNTYDVYVTPAGGSQITLGTNYKYHTGSFNPATADTVSGINSAGHTAISNIQVSSTASPSAKPKKVGGLGKSTGGSSSTGTGSSYSTGTGSSYSTGTGSSYSTGTGSSYVTTATTGAEPGPTNTGPTNSSILKQSGSFVVTTPNAVISNIAVTGTIYIDAPNVTLSNFTVNAGGNDFCVNVVNPAGAADAPNANSVTMSNGELTNAYQAAINGSDWTARQMNIHQLDADAADGDWNCTLLDSWIHNIGMVKAAHADGFQSTGGGNVLIQGNNFDIPWQSTVNGVNYQSNSCIFLEPNFDPIENVTIDGNWLDGGNYSIYALDDSNIVVENNVFGPDSQWGPIYHGTGSVAVWSNNTVS